MTQDELNARSVEALSWDGEVGVCMWLPELDQWVCVLSLLIVGSVSTLSTPSSALLSTHLTRGELCTPAEDRC